MNSFLKLIKYLLLTIIAGFILFALARGLFCGPDRDVEKVALPLAKVIFEHIETKGVPKTLNDIKNLPYKTKCDNRSIREHKSISAKTKTEKIISIVSTEKCSFSYNEKLYRIILNVTQGVAFDGIHITLDITYDKTMVQYKASYEEYKWKYINYPDSKASYGFGTRQGLCKAQPLRLTQ
ncbi:MAG: hypothetical protein ABFR02_10600 [Campylobacterota bacterium]